MIKILHISQTDISRDPRILKEMRAISGLFEGVEQIGVGGEMLSDLEIFTNKDDFLIKKYQLRCSKWSWLPKIIRHVLTLVEVTIKFLSDIRRSKPNIIHVHDVPVLPVACISKLFIKTKIIYDAHELESNKNGTTWVGGKLTYLVEKILWRHVDAFITVSNQIAAWYNECFGEKFTRVVLNSPNFIKLPCENLKKSVKTGYLHDKFVIPAVHKIFLYVGELGSGRSIDKILDIFTSEPESSHVVFLGYGSLKDRIVHLSKYNPNIHYHQPVKYNEIDKVARGADYGLCLIEKVSLSDYFCLPNKLFEYVFSGLPVLCSDFPEMAHAIDKYGFGVKASLDFSSLKAQISGLSKLKNTNRVKTDTLWDISWEAQVHKIKQIYVHLLP